MKKALFAFLVANCFCAVTSSFAQVTANFSYSGGCQPTTTIQFTDMSISNSGSIMTWAWSFGDGHTSTMMNPDNNFLGSGVYNVVLTVTDNNGNSSSVTKAVEVKLIASLGYSLMSPVCSNASPVSVAYAYVNNLVQGSGVYSGIGVNAMGMFNPMVAGTGTHNVAYTFTTTQGCLSTITQIITVLPPVQLILDTAVCATALPLVYLGHSYYSGGTYTDTIYGSAGCDTVVNLTVIVKPSSSTSVNVSVCSNNLPYSWNGNLYYNAGNYKDTLVNAFGCDSFVTLHLTIKPLSISTTSTTVCVTALPYLWNGYSHNSAGIYSVTLVNSVGCDSIARLILTVTPFVSSNFSYTFIDSFCSGRTVAFNPVNSANIYRWDFGDGTPSSAAMSPIHLYPIPGTYLVKLAVGNSCGFDSIIQALTILPENKTILPAAPSTLFANRECDADSGWTNYYFDNNTPANTNDDTLLLSLKLNGQYIGKIGDGIFQLKVVATSGAGSNTGIPLTNPLITNPTGYWVMNRYWNVAPAFQPASPVGVRFYFNTQDLIDVNGSYPLHNLSMTDLMFYKTTGGNPDPTTNLAGAIAITTIENGFVADTAHWVYTALSANSHVAAFEVSHFSGGGGGATGNGQVLPQRITSFDAINKGQINLLTWTTCAQVKGFEIQRSQNTSDFSLVSYVAAETGVCRPYKFSDNEPFNGANYYRLKMIDNDGKISYSVIRTVVNNGGINVAIFPNPAKNFLSLQLTGKVSKAMQVQMFNAEGKILQTLSFTTTPGTTIKGINVASLKCGNYYLKLTSGNETNMVRFEKL